MAVGLDSGGWDHRYGGRDLTASWSQTEALAPERAIDLACGEGRNAIWLAERGWPAVGVDFSEVGLQKAREFAAARGVSVAWVLADLLEYRPEPRAFDLVLILYLQVPAAQRRSVVRAAAQAVRCGGARSCSSLTTTATFNTDTAVRRIPPCSTARYTSLATSTAPDWSRRARTACSGPWRPLTETVSLWMRSCAHAAPTERKPDKFACAPVEPHSRNQQKRPSPDGIP